MAGIWRAYTSSLAKRPLTTKMGTACGLGAFGDAMAQKMTMDSGDKFDTRRFIAQGAFAGCYTGCVQHIWFNVLARRVTSSGLKGAALKTFLDQIVFVPVAYVPTFFLFSGAVRGDSLTATLNRMNNRYVDTLVANWSIWLPAAGVMFSVIPTQHQVVFAASCGLIWNTVLSLKANTQEELKIEADVLEDPQLKIEVNTLDELGLFPLHGSWRRSS